MAKSVELYDAPKTTFREDVDWASEMLYREHLKKTVDMSKAPSPTALYMFIRAKANPSDFSKKIFDLAAKEKDNRDRVTDDGREFMDIASRANKAFRGWIKSQRKCPTCGRQAPKASKLS